MCFINLFKVKLDRCQDISFLEFCVFHDSEHPNSVLCTISRSPRWRSCLFSCGFQYSTDWTPRHWHQDLALHGLDQRHCLMNSVTPSLNAPRKLSSRFSLLEVCKLPKMVDCVQVANLHEPSSDALHHLTSCLQPFSPVGLPLE